VGHGAAGNSINKALSGSVGSSVSVYPLQGAMVAKGRMHAVSKRSVAVGL
jgi:hypothetical protein